MTFARRALLYVARKRGKTLTLLLILLVVATMALTGLAIRQATATAQLNVRQALGGMFALQQNTSDASLWKNQDVGGLGSQTVFAGTPITDELGRTVAEQVDGIRGWNGTYQTALVPETSDGEVLDLVEEEGADPLMQAVLAGYGDFAQAVQVFAATNTAFDSYFANGYLRLVAGEPVTSEAGDAALVNKEFAELNGLEVGDTIVLRRSSVHAQASGVDIADTRVAVRIAGIYEATAKSTALMSNLSMENAVFTTMGVVDQARGGTAEQGYERIDFYVDDPARLDAVMDRVRQVAGVDWSNYTLTADTSGADQVVRPLANMDRLVTVLVVVVLAVGAAVLYLVLAARVRDRLHESGVLLCLGESRAAIAGQYLLEAALVAAVAFACAFPASSLVAQQVGERLLSYSAEQVTGGSGQGGADSPAGGVASMDGVGLVSSDALAPQFAQGGALTEIDVAVDAGSMGVLCAAGLAIVAAAVALASAPMLRMTPKEILGRMG